MDRPALGRFLAHRFRHAVGGKHQGVAGRDVVQVFDKDGALGAQVVDDVGVVDDFVAHVDGRAELLQGPLDDLDGAVHAGAKAARLGQQNFAFHFHSHTLTVQKSV